MPREPSTTGTANDPPPEVRCTKAQRAAITRANGARSRGPSSAAGRERCRQARICAGQQSASAVAELEAVDPAVLAATLACWNDYYRPRSEAARQYIALCARADAVLERCNAFLESLLNGALLPCENQASRLYLRCSGKWTALMLRYVDILPQVLAYGARVSRAAPAATAAPAGTEAAGAAAPAQPGAPLSVPADLPVAPLADGRTSDAMVQEGPSKGSLLRCKSLCHCDFPSTRLGYDEPSFGHPGDRHERATLALCIRQGPHDPRPPPDRSLCRAA
jgi:hypothetical protein